MRNACLTTTIQFPHIKNAHRRRVHSILVCRVLLYFVSTVTSARIPGEYAACHRARNLCVISRVQKGTQRLTDKGCVLQRVSLGVLSDVTVVLGMRQSIYNT